MSVEQHPEPDQEVGDILFTEEVTVQPIGHTYLTKNIRQIMGLMDGGKMEIVVTENHNVYIRAV